LAPTFEASLSPGEAMAAQRDRNRKELVAQRHKETTVPTKKAKIKEKTRLKSDEALAKAQEALKTAQAKVKRERQARAKAEKSLAEAQEALAAARLKVEHPAQIRRVSFVVRLTVYEQGQVGRTEIEHVESSRKQNFLSLDGERLVAFMKACTSPTIISEPTIPPIQSNEKAKAPILEPFRLKSNLIVSEVRVFHLGYSDSMTLVLTGEEPFGLRARFQLQGPDAQSLTTYASSFEIKLYANEVTSGESKLLTTYSAKLIQDLLEYTASTNVPGLAHGLYRLFTLVILSKPIKIGGYHDGPVIQVI
jgi:hypothetical protein